MQAQRRVMGIELEQLQRFEVLLLEFGMLIQEPRSALHLLLGKDQAVIHAADLIRFTCFAADS